jgi:hypothetical protein
MRQLGACAPRVASQVESAGTRDAARKPGGGAIAGAGHPRVVGHMLYASAVSVLALVDGELVEVDAGRAELLREILRGVS